VTRLPWGRVAGVAVAALLARQWVGSAGAQAAPWHRPPSRLAPTSGRGPTGPHAGGGASAGDEVAQIGEVNAAFASLAIATSSRSGAHRPPTPNAGVAPPAPSPGGLEVRSGHTYVAEASAHVQPAIYNIIRNYALS